MKHSLKHADLVAITMMAPHATEARLPDRNLLDGSTACRRIRSNGNTADRQH